MIERGEELNRRDLKYAKYIKLHFKFSNEHYRANFVTVSSGHPVLHYLLKPAPSGWPRLGKILQLVVMNEKAYLSALWTEYLDKPDYFSKDSPELELELLAKIMPTLLADAAEIVRLTEQFKRSEQ